MATDLRPQPLAKAQKNAERFGTSEQMAFRVCDGLEQVPPGIVDTVICAGMGGDTIAAILKKAPWVRTEDVTLILQPQSSGNDLRRWLGEEGFSILEEQLVEDGKFLYAAMKVRFGNGVPLTPGAQYASAQLLQSDPALVMRYLTRLERSLEGTVAGIAQGNSAETQQRLEYYQTALLEIREMRRQHESR